MELSENSRRGNRDRISALKDEELHAIMSFLTTKEAVRTCILSKRWKRLWTTLPFLDFAHNYGDDVERFINFVNTTLLCRKPTGLQAFRLFCEEWHSSSMPIESWILYALWHNPKMFDVEVEVPITVPITDLTCSSLEDVSLSFVHLPDTGVIELPHLRRLCLWCTCVRQDFVEKLFCGCPLLESLNLNYCTMAFSTIRSQSLKYLHVDTGCDEKCMVTEALGLIEAPNLLTFYFSNCPNYFEYRTIMHTPSLTDATLYFRSYCSDLFNYRKTNLLAGISNVGYLKLFIKKEILENELLGCPKFFNLKDLVVDGLCLSCHFNMLASFIDHIPNLEKLSLIHRGCLCLMCEEHGNRESLEISPFECKQLKTVNVKSCIMDKDFPQVMKYLQESVLNLGVQICMSSFPIEKYVNWNKCCCASFKMAC